MTCKRSPSAGAWVVTRSVSEEKLVPPRRVQSLLDHSEVLLTSGGSGNAGFLARSRPRLRDARQHRAGGDRRDRGEVDDAIELARATTRFSLHSSVSLFRRCWSAKCRAARHGLMEAACLTLQNASLASDAGDPRPAHGIDGMPAVY
jgi:hypothetical protein